MMKILLDLLLEADDTKDRHKQDAVLKNQNCIINNDYVKERFNELN